jgi:hypothetical protein
VELIVQAQAADSSDIFKSQRCQQETDVCHIVGNMVLPEDVALHDAGLLGLADVADSTGENRIAIVCAAVSCEKADESLRGELAPIRIPECPKDEQRALLMLILTENEAIGAIDVDTASQMTLFCHRCVTDDHI